MQFIPTKAYIFPRRIDDKLENQKLLKAIDIPPKIRNVGDESIRKDTNRYSGSSERSLAGADGL